MSVGPKSSTRRPRRFAWSVGPLQRVYSSPASVDAQGVTGALIGTVQDQYGGAIAGAQVRISSPAMIGARSPRPLTGRVSCDF